MKIIVPLSLVIAGCILAAGCVGQIKSTATNTSAVTTANTFTPFSNVTAIPNSINSSSTNSTTTNSTTTNSTTPLPLKGQLTISSGGWIGEFPISIDNANIGNVATQRPMTLMINEGTHIVKVCCGVVCAQENVTIRFGEQRTVDFSERLKENCEFLEPAALITGYFLSGDQITVKIEFINPTTKDLTISAEVICGYSYIESRSNNRVGNSAQGQVFSTVKAGERITQALNLNLASGYSYNYGIPTITKISYK